jgi:predicted AAA+ superfamily ATPase
MNQWMAARAEPTPSLAAFGNAVESLALFREVLADDVGSAFRDLVQSLTGSGDRRAIRVAWGRLFVRLADEVECSPTPLVGDAWQTHLLDRLLLDDNPFSRKAQRVPLTAMGPALRDQAREELRALQHLFRLDASRLRAVAQVAAPGEVWPGWDGLRPLPGPPPETAATLTLKQRFAAAADWGELLAALATHYAERGTGIFARFCAFRWTDGSPCGHLEGIVDPDLPQLDDLVAYDAERALLLRNTEHFLAGFPANNVLIYGDRGTGKSSTIKSLLSAYGDQGLRLVEVTQAQLEHLPHILRVLRNRRERFLLFVDDLSFQETETGYKALKALVEGSLEARPANVLLYATSNRRHLVQERFADREAAQNDDLHPIDTAQEKLSLSDRFGITITFLTPDQDRYLVIVRALASARDLPIDAAELERRALQWAMHHNGRSGRSARQFVDYLTAELGMPRASQDGRDTPRTLPAEAGDNST